MCMPIFSFSTAYPDIASRVKEDEDRTKENPLENSTTMSKGEEMLDKNWSMDDAIVRRKMIMIDEMALLNEMKMTICLDQLNLFITCWFFVIPYW